MKKIFAILGLLIYSGSSMAQAPGYEDLIILFADGKYEKLITEATKYTEKEATSKDPLPYLWLSKGLYAISQKGEKDEIYKNAFKESLGALGNFRKKDKDGSLFAANMDFVEKLKSAVLEEISGSLDAKQYKKVIPVLMKYYKIMPDDVGGKYLEGACKFRDADKGGANTVWKVAEQKLNAITSIENWSDTDKAFLKIGVFQAAECYIASKQSAKARTLLDKVAPWFEADDEFKEKYDALNF